MKLMLEGQVLKRNMAEQRDADVYEPYEGMDGSDFVDPEDYAKGGLAKLLGE